MADKPKLLMIDDDDKFRGEVEAAAKATFDFIGAHDGEQGVKLAMAKLPHAIICDVIMPKVSGIEVVRQLQSDLDARAIPVIVITASHANPATESLFKDEPNFFAFVRKPCKIPDLLAKVQEAVASRSS